MGSLICVFRKERNSSTNVMRKKMSDISSLLQRIKSMADVLFTMIYLFLFYQVHIKHTRNYVFLKHALSLNILFLFQFINFVTIRITFLDQIQQ